MELISMFFYKVVYMSIIASIIGLSIMLIRKFLCKHISPKIIYAMWIIFLLALVVPPFISSKTSVYNYIDVSKLKELTYKYETYDDLPSSSVSLYTQSNVSEKKMVEETTEKNDTGDGNQATKPIPSLKDILPTVWFVGVVSLFAIYVISNVIFNKKIGNKNFEDERIRNIFEASKKKFRIRRKIELINQDVVSTPAIVGTVKPKILLTERLKDNTDAEIEYIFRHELAHFKRNDNAINFVLFVLRTIHWFNPVVWIVMREIKKDMEFTADEKAVKGLEIEDRKEYCKLLVNLSNNSNAGFMEKAIGIANDKNNLEKRINMIKLSDKLSKHPVFSAMLVFVIIGLICLVLYTNNYYQPKLDIPPKLYVESPKGKRTELLLSSYEWINGTDVKTYDIGFDPETFEFKDENTVFGVYEEDDLYNDMYKVLTEPKYKFSYINTILYQNFEGTEMELDHYTSQKHLYPNINDVEYDAIPILSADGIEEIEVYFPNGSKATYVAKIETYTFFDFATIKKYVNTDIADKSKVETLVKEMYLADFLNELKIENNTLTLKYQYAQSPRYAYNMAVVLFTEIPKLEKVIISTEQKEVLYRDDVETNISAPIEITRDIANQNADKSIEELQKFIKES